MVERSATFGMRYRTKEEPRRGSTLPRLFDLFEVVIVGAPASPQVSLRSTRRLNGVGRFHRPLRPRELVSAFYDLVKNDLYPID